MSAIRSQITDTEIAGGGVGLVKIRNHPRDRKYAEASTIFFFFSLISYFWDTVL
jgi:hypothetical protein